METLKSRKKLFSYLNLNYIVAKIKNKGYKNDFRYNYIKKNKMLKIAL